MRRAVAKVVRHGNEQVVCLPPEFPTMDEVQFGSVAVVVVGLRQLGFFQVGMGHSSRAEPAESGKLSTHGLNTGTRAFTYSAVSRETTVRP